MHPTRRHAPTMRVLYILSGAPVPAKPHARTCYGTYLHIGFGSSRQSRRHGIRWHFQLRSVTPLALSPVGLLLAAAMSVTNVFTDVARKHALDKRDLIPATFWIRVAVAAVFVVALAVRIAGGAAIEIRDSGP